MNMREGILHIQNLGHHFEANSRAEFSYTYDLETQFPVIQSGKRDAIYMTMKWVRNELHLGHYQSPQNVVWLQLYTSYWRARLHAELLQTDRWKSHQKLLFPCLVLSS